MLDVQNLRLYSRVTDNLRRAPLTQLDFYCAGRRVPMLHNLSLHNAKPILERQERESVPLLPEMLFQRHSFKLIRNQPGAEKTNRSVSPW